MDWRCPSVSYEDDCLYVKQLKDRKYEATLNDWLVHLEGWTARKPWSDFHQKKSLLRVSW